MSDTPLRLFCLPYAGGSARIFMGWKDDLPDFMHVTPVELPGRGTRFAEGPIGEIEPLVNHVTETVLSQLDMPFALLGYGYGALLGFEVARRLEHNIGVRPRHLLVAAMPAPMWPRPASPVSGMSDAQFREFLGKTKVVKLPGHQELIDMLIPILRADYGIVDNYRYRPHPLLRCPITAFGGVDDPQSCEESLQAWALCTRGAFSMHRMRGGYFFLRSARHDFLRRISAALHEVTRIPRPA